MSETNKPAKGGMTEARLEEIESAASNGGTMSKERLAAVKERCGKATEGPWEIKHPLLNDPDDVFIAHARTDIPDLVAEVESLSERLRMYDDGEKITDQHNERILQNAVLKRELAEARSAVERLQKEVIEAKLALIAMLEQYCTQDTEEGTYWNQCMTAGEAATFVLGIPDYGRLDDLAELEKRLRTQ